MRYTHIRKSNLPLSLQIQVFISSRNILKDTPQENPTSIVLNILIILQLLNHPYYFTYVLSPTVPFSLLPLHVTPSHPSIGLSEGRYMLEINMEYNLI